MFEFKFFEAVHWDFWERIALPFDGQLLTVVGPNGSGKTTLLDGLRTLLGIDCSADRDYRRYVRRNNKPVAWLRAVVSNNKTPRGKYSFHPWFSSEVTLVCRVKRKGGDWVKDYAVLEGNVSIEEIEAKVDKNWHGLKEYRSLLERAGLGRAIRKVLTLEQGATDKLCTMKPRELLTLVFEAHGEQEILDKYQEAKNEQITIHQEIEGLKQDLGALELEVKLNQSKVESYNEWKRKKEHLEKLVCEDIPRLELLELSEQTETGRLTLKGLRRDFTKISHELKERRTHQENLNQHLSEAKVEWEHWEGEERNRRDQLNQTLNTVNGLKKILEEKARLEALQKQQAEGFDPDQVAVEKKTMEQGLAETNNRIRELEKEAREAQGRLTALIATRTKDLPSTVKRMRENLVGKGVSHQLLSEVVDILLPEWQPVIEGLIAGDAFTVLLDRPQDKAIAWDIGEKERYRWLVTADRIERPFPRPGSLLEAVGFKAPAPSWIITRLDQTLRVEDANEGAALSSGQNWVSRKGYYKESRGGRYVAVDLKRDYVFGEAAVLAEIEDLEGIVNRCRKDLRSLEGVINDFNGKISDCSLLLEGWDADANLKARMAEFVQVGNDLPRMMTALSEDEARLQEAVKSESEAKNTYATFLKSSGIIENQVKSKEKESREAKKKITDKYENVVSLMKKYSETRLKFSPEERSDHVLQAIRAEHNSLQDAHASLRSIRNDLDSREWETDPQVVLITQKLKYDFEVKRGVVNQRREHHVRALTLTEQARGQYINVLYATLRSYVKNIRALGDMAGVEAIATLPRLENDDVSLAQAGLEIEFRFDQKETDETSGGQKVIKSLVLLVGLMMDKDDQSGGFVFIDEPFAHLDVLNINLVSNFLRRSKAQYVLTTPNTHNIDVFKASDLTFVTRSWKAPAKWAPPVAWARRQESKVKEHA
jgi:chromosome segregation ATPase